VVSYFYRVVLVLFNNIVIEPEDDFTQDKRGAVDPTASGKSRIRIWLDEDIITWFRQQVHLADGGNYQLLS